jgi:hypothetical protein
MLIERSIEEKLDAMAIRSEKLSVVSERSS